MSDYKVGGERKFIKDQEVWVKATITSPGDTTTSFRLWARDLGFVNHDPRVRTEADFKDPLDEAIVQAAEQAYATGGLDLANWNVWKPCARAVQAKLDSIKPNTAADVHLAHYDLDKNGRCSCSELVVGLGESRPEKHAAHIAEKLDAAGYRKVES